MKIIEKKFGKYNKNILLDSVKDLLPKSIYNRKKLAFILPYEKYFNEFELSKYSNIGKLNVYQIWALKVFDSIKT